MQIKRILDLYSLRKHRVIGIGGSHYKPEMWLTDRLRFVIGIPWPFLQETSNQPPNLYSRRKISWGDRVPININCRRGNVNPHKLGFCDQWCLHAPNGGRKQRTRDWQWLSGSNNDISYDCLNLNICSAPRHKGPYEEYHSCHIIITDVILLYPRQKCVHVTMHCWVLNDCGYLNCMAKLVTIS